MHSLLFVTSSLFGEASQSRRFGIELITAMRSAPAGIRIVERNLTADNMPHLSGATLAALGTPVDQRNLEQLAVAAFADGIIEEVEAADVIVIAAPMYNFTIPSTLKAWIDHLARAGRTFRYTADGPVGLLKGKKVYVVAARGGVYTQGPAKALDFQEPYLRAVLSFVGLDDVTFIHAEGFALGAEATEKGIEQARQEILSIGAPEMVVA